MLAFRKLHHSEIHFTKFTNVLLDVPVNTFVFVTLFIVHFWAAGLWLILSTKHALWLIQISFFPWFIVAFYLFYIPTSWSAIWAVYVATSSLLSLLCNRYIVIASKHRKNTLRRVVTADQFTLFAFTLFVQRRKTRKAESHNII